MKYTVGTPGRVAVARVDDGDDLIAALEELVRDTGIDRGYFHCIGALRSGDPVAGPVEPVIPPVPNHLHFDGAWEIVGTGTVFPCDGSPKIHLHGALGVGEHTMVGCLRTRSEVFLVIEIVLVEITGTNAVREYDTPSGHFLLSPSPGEAP